MEDKRKKGLVFPKDISGRNLSIKNFSLKKIKKDQVLILFLVGILLLVISWPVNKKDEEEGVAGTNQLQPEDSKVQESQNAYLSYTERHLEEVLSQMAGVGDVTVMITLKSSAEKVVEKDVEAGSETVTESDSQGGTRTTQNSSHSEATVYDTDSSQNQSPYISKELSPQVEGVIVIAEGGDDSVVKQNITEAVQALFGIDTHKIRIMKKSLNQVAR